MRATSLRFVASLWLAGALSLADSAPVHAQGRGHGPPVASTNPTRTSTSAATLPAGAAAPITAASLGGSRLATFGSWLDNADVNSPGEVWLSLSTAYWRSQSLREIDAPALGASAGIAPRVHVGVSVPYYYVTDEAGFTSHGFGATYVTGKIALTNAARVAAAISPTLEILSWRPVDARVKRVNWIFPLSVQTDVDSVRLYGTGGYASRGSVFGTGAAEWAAGSRVTLVATLAHMYSVADDAVSDALGITRHRTDASGGVYVQARPTVVLFASLGRTMRSVSDSGSGFSLGGGLAVNVAGPATRAPRVP